MMSVAYWLSLACLGVASFYFVRALWPGTYREGGLVPPRSESQSSLSFPQSGEVEIDPHELGRLLSQAVAVGSSVSEVSSVISSASEADRALSEAFSVFDSAPEWASEDAATLAAMRYISNDERQIDFGASEHVYVDDVSPFIGYEEITAEARRFIHFADVPMEDIPREVANASGIALGIDPAGVHPLYSDTDAGPTRSAPVVPEKKQPATCPPLSAGRRRVRME